MQMLKGKAWVRKLQLINQKRVEDVYPQQWQLGKLDSENIIP